MNDWSDEETDEPLIADHCNFYKVEKWSSDGQRVTELLAAAWTRPNASSIVGQSHRPRIRMTIRQRTRVLDEWPLE